MSKKLKTSDGNSLTKRFKEREDKICLFFILLAVLVLLIFCLTLYVGKLFAGGTHYLGADVFEICNCLDGEVPDTHGDDADETGLVVSDALGVWGEHELRLFENPLYNLAKIIAPGSKNSYQFRVANRNDFAVLVDLTTAETNEYGVNMRYKLLRDGAYVVGDANNYAAVSELAVRELVIPAGGEVNFQLDWMWVDSEGDTAAGVALRADYSLSLKVLAVEITE